MADQTVRVRFAPSPTGYLHVGGARTALYNYLYAKHTGGEFILRIEDTDEARSTEESMRMQIADLQWLGMKWSEGPDPDSLIDVGAYGPYRQSRRLDIYKEHAQRLLEEGQAYYCFMTDEEIEVQRQAAIQQGRPPQVNSPYRDWPIEKAQERLDKGDKAVVRFKVVEKRDYVLQDLVRGEVTFPSDMVGDFVLLRSTGMPVYNFCCVVDDALMKITHVFRAEEHLSNSLRQMMLYHAFNYPLPKFGHLSVVLGSDKQKLSKRHGATSCHDYAQNGYLPEALNNFVALLGWSSPAAQEILSMEELIAQFDYDRLNASPAVFDEQKLNWVNATHLRALPNEELWKRVEPFLNEAGLKLPADSGWRFRALDAFKTSMTTLKDAVELFRPLSETPVSIATESEEVLGFPTTRAVIEAWKAGIEQAGSDYLTEEQFNKLQDSIKDSQNVKGKQLFQPIRVAVIGKPQGTELKMLVPLMHKRTLLARADQVLSRIKG
ncbi:MAG: glutamate--tRNA ligase [Bdellovibrionales bacterium]|nr:glutamate--tRNA ligase [Bdellovibrionales bacterium]